MQEEKDYLQREIERITLFLKTLLRRVAGFSDEASTPDYDQLERELQTQVDFSFQQLETMDADALKKRIASLPEVHVEQLAEIGFQLLQQGVPKAAEQFARNISVMLEYVNQKSAVFSLQRQHMLTALSEIIEREGS